MNDRLDKEALTAAYAGVLDHLRALVAEQPQILVRALGETAIRGAAAAAIAGWIGCRAGQAEAQHIDTDDWNDFIGCRGAFADDALSEVMDIFT